MKIYASIGPFGDLHGDFSNRNQTKQWKVLVCGMQLVKYSPADIWLFLAHKHSNCIWFNLLYMKPRMSELVKLLRDFQV